MNEFLKNNHPCELDNKLNSFNTSEEIHEIKLFNRDGADLKLISEDEKLWKFTVDDKHNYVLQYIRIGFELDNKTICMVDPSGGPCLTIGTKIGTNFIIDAFIELDDKLMVHTNKI